MKSGIRNSMNSAIKLATIAAVAAGSMWPTVARGTNGSGAGDVSSVSCPSAGNCAAVGSLPADGVTATFVVNQTHGTWGRAQLVKGLAALPDGGARLASLFTVSCSSAGNCSAGGNYLDHANAWHPFVVTQANGVWGRAKEIVLPTPHSRLLSELDFVSCRATGDCTAAGVYPFKSSALLFTVTEQNGAWGKATELPGMTRLNSTGDGNLFGLSCASVGNCAVAGIYTDARGGTEAMVATETDGTWGNAQEVPGTAGVNKGNAAYTNSVSCPAAGRCLAVGYYTDSGSRRHPFITSQVNGSWRRIEPVPGLASLPGGAGSGTDLQWAWCASPGNCTAVGSYSDIFANFDVTERNGTWGNARKIRLGARQIISITSVACASLGNCSAGGWFAGTGSQEVFVITKTHGIWGKAEEVPGSVKLNHGGSADLNSVACGAPGDCVAGGDYSPKWPLEKPFLVTQTNGLWGNMLKVSGLP